MDSTRELDQIRRELTRLEEKNSTAIVSITRLEAASDEKFSNILKCLESIQRDMDTLRDSISNLESMATKGETSLKTLLWVGGTVAAITTLLLTIYSYIPK